MTETSVFAATLGLSSPWRITGVSFFDKERKVVMLVDFDHVNAFRCPTCEAPARVHDTATEVWHHDDFFRFSAYIHARVPDLICSGGCGVRKAELPWTRDNSRFVLLDQPAAPTLPKH